MNDDLQQRLSRMEEGLRIALGEIQALKSPPPESLLDLNPPKFERLRVALLSKSDAEGGGASKGAEQIHMHLMKRKHYATHFCSYARGGFNPYRRPLVEKHQDLVRKLHFYSKRLGVPELFPFELPSLRRQMKQRQMMIAHVHDISSAISPLTLYYLSRQLPIIWTIHDISPVTAGCIYPIGCERYKTHCYSCPQTGTWPFNTPFVFARFLHSVKKFVHTAPNLHLSTPSRWMANLVESSGVTDKKVKVIPYGIDLQEFKAINKQMLRQKLGLPQDRPIILVGAGEGRKGFRSAVQVVREVQKDLNPILLIMGHLTPGVESMLEGIDFRALGYVPENHLNQAYACADLFLFCSIADNFPGVVTEAIVSGTPVISYATGGVAEIVTEGKTGRIVPQHDILAAAQAIRDVYRNNRIPEWSAEARRDAEIRFDQDRYIDEHIEYYREVIRLHQKPTA